MIQFIRVATIDPEGFALIRLEDISGIQTAPSQDEVEYSRIITKHEQYLVRGSMEHFTEQLRSTVGGEFDMTPEVPE